MSRDPQPSNDSRSVLRDALAGGVSETLKRRGADYWARGAVRLTVCAAGQVTAVVRGTRQYALSLSIEGTELRYHCDCPYAARGELCKHVWAFVLEIDHSSRCREFVTSVAQLPLAKLQLKAVTAEPRNSPATSAMLGANTNANTGVSVGMPSGARWQPGAAPPTLQAQRWRKLVAPPVHPAAQLLGDGTSETWYLIDLQSSGRSPFDWRHALLLLHTADRNRTKRGTWGRPIRFGKAPEGSRPEGIEGLVWALARNGSGGVVSLSEDLALEVLPELSRLGRLGAVRGQRSKDVTPLEWDGAVPWRVELVAEPYVADDEVRSATTDADSTIKSTKVTEVRATLYRRNEQRYESLDVDAIETLLPLDLFVCDGKLMRVEATHSAWVKELSDAPLRLTTEQLSELSQSLRKARTAPRLVGANDAESEPTLAPSPRLRLSLPEKTAKLVRGALTFRYGDREVGAATGDVAGVASVTRDYDAETGRVEQLRQLGISLELQWSQSLKQEFALKFDSVRFVELVPQLMGLGFDVELEGRKARRPASWTPVLVQSGQDWFGIEGAPDFEGELVGLPDLLKAVREQRSWVKLSNGGIGLLPQEWRDSLAALADWVPPRAKEFRLHAIHGWVVQRALGQVSQVSVSRAVEEMCARFERFERIEPLKEPVTFRGQLRGYQRLALGWLHALDELGFGGCLADDMGLGKTIVVLAWLLRRIAVNMEASVQTLPSLLVVPTSLLFNWQREAERFAPSLRVLVHHGPDREPPGEHFRAHDLVITSYGTLRRDAEALGAVPYDYVVLDEAHAIKNAWTESYTAASSLVSKRRLALTGTPLENHLGELWNLLVFLNPAILQGMTHLQRYFEKRKMAPSDIEHGVLRSLRPFILRRTKAEVARDLPDRIEKTLTVRLSKAERKQYDELAEYYRRRLLENRAINRRHKQRGSADGKQTAEVLVALLRLRQTACHCGLLDTEQRDLVSAKFDVLLTYLTALHAEGHKALVFSQFTELLQLLMPHLDRAGITYAHMDGSTRDREAQVDRFTNDPEVGVFLISLKAGGVGLNLVAAEYVFLLDPWWNPASEAQAIDRAHRIGQRRSVIAYRLLAENTVEEKVAQLQEEKRAMALSLFGDETNFSAKFTKEDLETLLGDWET